MGFLRILCALSLCMSVANAADNITVTVQTKIATAKALGYRVGDAKSGGMGTLYKGQGPKNKEYVFGFRKVLFGEDITCGRKTLNKDTVITLVNQGEGCAVVVSN